MSNLLKSALVPAVLALTAVTFNSAAAWERNVTTTGPYGGTYKSHRSGSCSGGTCSSSQHFTGPYGRTVTRSGSTTCSGGVCNGTATYTGPRGRTVTRSRSFRR